jgi:hypothetical protein
MNELRLVIDMPSAESEGPEEVAAGLARVLAERAHELTRDLHAVMAEASRSGSGVALLDDVHADACTANVRSILAAMVTQTDFDPTSAAHAGAVQARRRMALTSLNEFYRIAFRRLWELVADEAAMDRG